MQMRATCTAAIGILALAAASPTWAAGSNSVRSVQAAPTPPKLVTSQPQLSSVGAGGCAQQYTAAINSLNDQAIGKNYDGLTANKIGAGASIANLAFQGGSDFSASTAFGAMSVGLYITTLYGDSPLPTAGGIPGSIDAGLAADALAGITFLKAGAYAAAALEAGSTVVGIGYQQDAMDFTNRAQALTNYVANLPNCDAEFTGTVTVSGGGVNVTGASIFNDDVSFANSINVDGDVNARQFHAEQGISAHGGAIWIGDPGGTTHSSGITIGGGALSGAGVGGALASTGDVSAVAVGNHAQATQAGAVALGVNATATGGSAIAIGDSARAAQAGAVALGVDAAATGGSAVAIGDSAHAAQAGAVALGANAAATGGSAIAIGNGVQATQAGAVALGLNASAAGASAVAFGSGSRALAASTTAMGAGTQATGGNATAVGVGSTAAEVRSTALGSESKASGQAATAIGSRSVASDTNATAVGNSAQALAIGTTAVGDGAAASGVGSSAFGQEAAASATNAFAGGVKATAGGTNSIAVGNVSSAAGSSAIALGDNAQATKDGAIAVGLNSNSAGTNAVAIGVGAVATGSVAVGTSASASNGGAAFGDAAVATGTNSTAVGPNSIATAADSAAIGSNSVANQANTVSVGSTGNQRRITNVAPALNFSDAVNLAQLSGVQQQVDADRREARSGVALSLAAGSLQFDPRPGKASIAAAVGGFKGQVGLAVGIGYSVDDRWRFNAAFSGSPQTNEYGAVASASWTLN